MRGRLRRTLLSGDQSGSYPAGSRQAWFCSRLVVALALLAWLLPQRAAATYVDEKSNYSVMLGGSNVIYFYAPVYDMDGADCWIYDGNLEVSVDGGSSTTIFHWAAPENVDNDDTQLSTAFSTTADGTFEITLGNSKSKAQLNKNNGRNLSLTRNGDGKTFSFEAEWTVPYNLLGKTLKFSWKVNRNGNGRTKEEVKGLDTKTIKMPAASAKLKPVLSTPMLTATSPGKLELPWFLASDSIVSAYYEYDDARGIHHKQDLNNISSGIITLDANEPHRNFRLVCSYKEAGSKGSYLIEGASTATQNIAMIHAPVGLTARPLIDRKAKVELTWNVPYLEDEDLTPTDFFEVQRSLTGKEEDFVTIGQEYFAKNKKISTYTFVDSTLIESVTANMLTGGGTLENLTYRVRRVITQEWGWNHNCAGSASCVVDRLHLLRIADYSAEWEDERAYTVRVSWNYEDEHGAVWDDRAKMILRVVSRNREGATVDSLTYVLEDNDRAKRYMIVNLTRSCVYYNIDMYVDRKDSPINFLDQTEEYFFPIHNVNDWTTFRDKVKNANGQDVNARLYADISLNSKDYIVGYSGNYPYGEGCLSGFVGRVTKSKVAIRNCKFDGSFEGDRCHGNSGFVSWVDEVSSATIENCLFMPDHIGTYTFNCNTWGRKDDRGSLTVTNGHYTRDYYVFPISNASDWQKFRDMVSASQCRYWVDAVLTADITTDLSIGWNEGSAYHGTFDGNGHTITFNISDTGAGYLALFRHGNGYTIKNLHLKGKVSGSDHSAGLVGHSIGGNGYNKIQNCRVSASIESSNMYAGGFGGNTTGGGGADITNCLFDGSIWCQKAQANGSQNWAAPFFGFSEPVDYDHGIHDIGMGQNYCLEKGTYYNIIQLAMNHKRWAHWGNGENTYCHDIWTYNGLDKGYGVGTRSVSQVVAALGDQWHEVGGLAVPKMTDSYSSNRWYTGAVTANEMVSALGGDGWEVVGGKAVPKMASAPVVSETSLDELLTKLGGSWVKEGETINPKTTSEPYDEYKTINDVVHHISSEADWTKFRALIDAADGKEPINAVLDADIKITNSAALYHSFTGTFDGNGHTIDVNISGVGLDNIALFCNVTGNTTIRNLHVTGTIRGNMHTAGLVGMVNGSDAVLTVERVRVSTAVTSTMTHAGGIIGHTDIAKVYMNDCLFDGSVTTNNSSDSYAGDIIGWCNGGSWTMHRVYDHGSPKANTMYFCIDHYGPTGQKTNWGSNPSSSCTVTQHNWDRVNYYNKTDQNEVVSLMNAELPGSWHLVDGKAVPVMTNTVYGTNGITGFYHKNTGEIEPTLLTTTRQSSVLLAWNTDGKPIDYFKVMRRVKGEGDDKWEEVATDLDQMSYEDKTVSPLATYEYKVLAVNDCEGVTTTETDVTVGECKHTGRLEGYVRFNDGTSAPDVSVSIYHMVGDEKILVKNVMTDESGFFKADELSYYGGESVDYKVVPVSGDDLKFEVEDYLVTFNGTSNNETVHEFIITNGKRFSGYVMYDGTSIPVKGVNFLVNGRKMHNAKGEVLETDYDGSFSFRVMDGDNTIQAVMDNHVFVGDGFYKNSNPQSIKSDVAGIYFYDATKVKLTGRIVGGDIQGKLPLDNNLSKNNLGDSIQMVLTLEGDNTSWLVYDNLNPNRTQREEVFRHKRNGDKHYTSVTTQRKRMEVTPDLTTGEYVLMLPPVRWKVQQVYCKGYPTLFQEGQVSEVVDLTNCLTVKDTTYVGSYGDIDSQTVSDVSATYNAVYNRIYHSPVEVRYRQIGYDTFDYFGDKEYTASELTGETTQVTLAYANPEDTTQAIYSFKHPVFTMERKYNIQVQVAEYYRYNNDPTSKPDMVPLGGGTAYMQNGMNSGALLKEPMPLDSLGRATFTMKANMTTTLLTDESALKTVTFSAEHDGNIYVAEPLQGYVLNMFPIGASQDILTDGQPLLFDILRDPPGAYSSNTLAKGATLNSTYMMNLSLTAGVYFHAKYGEKLETVSAAVAATGGVGSATGPISVSDIEQGDVDMFMYNANGSKAFSYTMVVGNNISTSSDPSMVGADADLYIGSVQNVVVTPMSTIRAVTKKMYNEMMARQGKGAMPSEVGKYDEYGTVVKIAEGEVVNIDKNKKVTRDTIFLVRDVALGYGPKVQSQFVYSQKQLLTQIIPAKAKEIVDLMYLGTKEEAQKIADKTKRPVYLSLREPTDSMFAVVNKKIKDHSYNTTIDKAEKGINYLVVLPSGKKESDFSDEVAEKYYIIKAWADMISRNEGEKLGAHDLLTNYDVAGAAGVNYSETFDTNYSNTFTHYFPIATEVDYWGAGAGVSHATSAISLAGTLVTAIALSLQEMKAWSVPSADVKVTTTEGGNKSQVTFGGSLFQWSLFPVLSYTTIGTNSETKAYNRTESFTIACDPSSHLNVDVYRVQPVSASGDTVIASNIFSNYNSNKLYDEVYKYTGKEVKLADIVGPRGFVFRTRGGSTQNPWEDKRVTQIYRPGTELDARTLKIVNPKIRLDKQSVSGVAIDDAAKFMVFVSNESEKPEATDGLSVLQVFAVDQLNPLGAQISINGQVLTTGGMTVTTVPGTETALTMEVRAGQGFDFENLAIGVMSPTDPEHTYDIATFDVHFLREAGGVNIAMPGDKWVLNTNAQLDSKRGWYLPVTINGFDRHQHNFDHIEFQYKESQRGDDSWTNLCSFYESESLMANANGVRKLIPENGNIVTEFYGEGWVMEREYDLRAVLFCRNGSDFLTTPSKVIHGIKDTRRPQLFGTPEPKTGLLYQGEDIVFNFSEDIEYNYLSAITNFEVKGEVNNDNLSEMVSVQFAGQASVETEAKRNFSGKDVTIDLMVKPAETNREMPLFSHGTNGQKLQLWLTEDFRLKAVVNDQEFTSDSVIGKNAFRQVAMVLNQKDSTLTFYKGGVQIGSNKLNSLYNGTGTLIFGRTNEQDRSASQYYEGRMMEARLWYAAMDGGLIGTTYGNRHLTGYEKDLVDYYPMNEGSGKYAADHTQGANAMLMGANWAIPRGYSLQLTKEDNGLLLDKNALNRTNEHDYTLMFWFNTDADGRGSLLSNGRGVKEDNGSENQFHIGFEGDKLMFRSNGFAEEVPGDWSDGQWHNFAMTVNRGRNVANIYMDKELVTTFEADSLGGISGGYPKIGATRYEVVKENGAPEVKDGDDALTGHVDELLFFAQALPEPLIKTYATKSPNGDEAGLLTYLSFDRQERQKDNSIELVPYAYSKKLYLDDKGEPRYQLDPLTKEPTDTLVRDYLFVDEIDEVMKHFTNNSAAPVVPYEEVTNLKFGFIGRGNQLLVELDEPAAKLHNRNLYVTVRDIEDKNGNTMASPQTACYYVSNSSLAWVVNRLDATIKYGSAESMEMPFYNWSASSHTYKIENCPKWLTLNKYSDVMTPQALDYVTATVSKDLNIGTYNEIIYLTDEEGISEPFYLNLTVEGELPDWANSVSGDLLQNSMSISGMVYLYDELDTDSRDIVGAFDEQNVCHGFANISHDAVAGDNGLYLTVYDNQASGRELNFRLWQYSTGREIVLTTTPAITFTKDAMLGADMPVRFDGGDAFMQNFKLQEGWNWVSFNLSSPQLSDVNKLLSSMTWQEGDMLTDLNSDTTLVYQNKQWLASGSVQNMVISPKKSYAIKVQKDCNFPIGGTVIKDENARTINLEKGWNAIGYTPVTNLTVETALSDYYDYAEQGDVIKSHTEFAYFTKSGNTGRWRGSLQYMKPGEGYMMLRKSDQAASFTYPFFELGSNFREDWTAAASRSAVARQARSTMTLSATVAGFEPEEGDLLVAYADGEVVGSEAFVAGDGQSLFFLSIAGDTQQPIWFAIERDGEIVAATDEIMTFKKNAVVGSPDEPTAINFARTDYENGKWYTVGGLQLQKKPTRKGLYIYNNKKVVIK